MTRNLPFCLAPTTLQLQINYIKSTHTFVTSSYVPNEDVCKVFWKTKECEKSEIIIIQTLIFKEENTYIFPVPTTLQLQINYIKSTQMLVTSSYVLWHLAATLPFFVVLWLLHLINSCMNRKVPFMWARSPFNALTSPFIFCSISIADLRRSAGSFSLSWREQQSCCLQDNYMCSIWCSIWAVQFFMALTFTALRRIVVDHASKDGAHTIFTK